jgi:dextranase
MNSFHANISNFQATPDCGSYPPGQAVTLLVSAESTQVVQAVLEARLFRGLELIGRQRKECVLQPGHNEFRFSFQPGSVAPAGYGVEVEVEDLSTGESLKCQTAFDVLNSWVEFPRYGFLCDFSPARQNSDATIETLNRFHLNGLQFYDWQYRHDSLVPPQDDFTDPLGRPLSLKATKDLIAAAHRHGMKAMPYLAIYAASAVFWKAHPQWALYDQDHHLIPFGEDFLGIMNPVAGGEWARHLLGECCQVLEQLPFDGLHIDQYGDPKVGFDDQGQPVDLPGAFSDFIRAAVEQHPQVPVLFNAVGNWPIEALAKAPVAFNYIEIWPPKTAYTDVAEIVRNARQLSGQKPVVIALYLPANRPLNNRLADAMIFSAGGTRIELGEEGRLLSDPYFPKHEAIDASFSEQLRRQIELVVRYADWVSPLLPESALPPLQGPAGLEYFFRKTTAGYSLSLVNLGGAQPLQWNEAHDPPELLKNFSITLRITEKVAKIWLVSPDGQSLSPQALEFTVSASGVEIHVPSLEIWDVLFIETLHE